jgi:hypothetical protein
LPRFQAVREAIQKGAAGA